MYIDMYYSFHNCISLIPGVPSTYDDINYVDINNIYIKKPTLY